MSNYHMGMDGFVWFTAVVEDRNDPAKLGRVRIRCLGLHTEDKLEIPTESLPWAHVMHPVTDPSMNGMGTTPSFLVEGTWVVGFFRDATEMQQPVVMGTLPGIPSSLGDPNKGFSDPNRRSDDENSTEYNQSIYPKDLGQSDVNALARNYDKDNTIIGLKDATRVLNIPSADDESWDEPASSYNSVYPKNHVFESESGHILEYDDTPGNQRLHEYSSSGTFYEIDAVGNKHTRVESNNTEVIKGTEFKYVGGDCNLTVAGTLNIKCNALNIEVSEDYVEEVDGDKTVRIKGTKSTDITGIILESFGDNYTRSIKGEVDERYGSAITRTMSGIVTNNHNANILNYITGDLEFHTSTAINIFGGTTINIDSTEAMTLDSGVTINLNNGSKGAARVDDPADTGDAGLAEGSNKIESGSTSVFIGDAAGSVTAPTEPTLLELIEAIEPEINATEPAAGLPGGGAETPTEEIPVAGNKYEKTTTSLASKQYGGPVSGATSTKSTESSEIRTAVYSEPGGCTRKDLGKISEKYESNGKPGAIGNDSTGGYSYGSYQIASKVGSMKNFIDFLQTESNGYTEFYTQLQNVGGDAAARKGTNAFKNKWRELAKDSRFSQAQHDFIQRTHYDPAVNKIKKNHGIDICGKPHSNGLQDAIWSSAVQHGPNGAVSIFKRALERLHNIKIAEAVEAQEKLPTFEETISTATDAEIITEIYNEKLKLYSGKDSRYIGSLAYFKRSTKSVQASVANRFRSEKSDALSLA